MASQSLVPTLVKHVVACCLELMASAIFGRQTSKQNDFFEFYIL